MKTGYKRIFILMLCWLSQVMSWGQQSSDRTHSISIGFSKSFATDYFDLGYSLKRGQHAFFVKMGVLKNQSQFLPDTRVLYKSLYASTFREQFGLGIGYNRALYTYNDIVELGAYGELFTWYCSNKKKIAYRTGYDTTGTFEVFESGMWYTEPNVVFQLNAGLSLKANLSKNVYVKTAFGFSNYVFFNNAIIRQESQVLILVYDIGDRIEAFKHQYLLEIGYTF